LAGAGVPTSDSKALKEFDSAVAHSRVEMRQYCALVQELMKAPDSEKQQTAIAHLRKAIELWKQVQQQYQQNPPAAYAADKQFAARLADMMSQLQEMEAHLAAGRFKASFQTCGFACGLFVQMHEENGLVYALDRLFHLRKTVKTASVAAQNNGLAGVRALLPVMQQRDRVLQAPCPAPENAEKCQSYRAAIKALSAKLDELAVTVAGENQAELASLFAALIKDVNTAYGLALQ
jgi:hypothetical protein